MTLSFWIPINSIYVFYYAHVAQVYSFNVLQVVQLTKFDYRLTNRLDDELQKLRCRVNYHALSFTKPIQDLGQNIVKRMRKMSSRFISVHLRYLHFADL